MDYYGQHLSEYLMKRLTVFSFVLSFLVGFFLKSVLYSFILETIFFFLIGILVIPSWPFYNKNPVRWISDKKKD